MENKDAYRTVRVYQAKRGWLIYTLMIGLLVLAVLVYLLYIETYQENPWIFLPILSPFVLTIWIFFDTHYKIEGNRFIYRSAFLRGEIDVENIRQIDKDKTMWVGYKPALATNGLIIRYNRFGAVYIAPKDKNELIEDLLKLNGNIVVKKKGHGEAVN